MMQQLTREPAPPVPTLEPWPGMSLGVGPGLQWLKATLAERVDDPRRVVDLLDAYAMEREDMMALLHQEVGNAFIDQVLRLEAIEHRLNAGPQPGPDMPLIALDGVPFAKGADDEKDIDPNDVSQGRLGDCFLVSAIGAMAKSDPEAIRRMITVLPPDESGQGRYQVSLWLYQPLPESSVRDDAKKKKTDIVVTTEFPAPAAQPGDTVDGKPELWVQLIEKAFATAVGGYRHLNGGWEFSMLPALTPGKVENHNGVGIELGELKRVLTEASAEGRPVTLAMSVHRRKDSDQSLVFTKVGGGSHLFWLDHVEGDMAEVCEGHGHRILLSFEEIQEALYDVDVGPKPGT